MPDSGSGPGVFTALMRSSSLPTLLQQPAPAFEVIDQRNDVCIRLRISGKVQPIAVTAVSAETINASTSATTVASPETNSCSAAFPTSELPPLNGYRHNDFTFYNHLPASKIPNPVSEKYCSYLPSAHESGNHIYVKSHAKKKRRSRSHAFSLQISLLFKYSDCRKFKCKFLSAK